MALRKNDRVVAAKDFPPFLTKDKIYVILGVKTLESGEVLYKVSTDQKKREYMPEAHFKQATNRSALIEKDF